MRVGRLVVTADLLCRALSLPPGTRVRHTAMVGHEAVALVLEHGEFPDVREGDDPTPVIPVFETDGQGRAIFRYWQVSGTGDIVKL